jgi:hypothetical protein
MTDDRTVSQLIDDATHDLSDIVRAEIALAKAELRKDAESAIAAGGMVAVAGYLGYLATFAGMLTTGFVLAAIGLPLWASFAVVTGLLVVIAAGLGFGARVMARRIKPPTQAMEQLRATVTLLPGRSSGDGVGSARRRSRSRSSRRPETSTNADTR